MRYMKHAGSMDVRMKWLRPALGCLVYALALANPIALAQTSTATGPLNLTLAEKTWLAAHPVIRMGVDPGYAPYAFIDAQGRPTGVSAELTALVGERLGVRLELVPGLKWPQILEAARERKLDLITTTAHLPEREEFLAFTRIYLPTPLVVMTRTETPRLSDLHELEHRRVALVKGYSSTRNVLDRLLGIDALLVAEPLAGLRAVSEGRADAYIGVLGVNTYLASRNGISNLKVNSGFDMANGQRYGVRKDWAELVPLLERALDSIPAEQQQAIFARWVSVSAESIALSAVDPDVSARVRGAPVPPTAEKALEVIAAVPRDSPPEYRLNEAGQPEGFAIELMNLIAQRAGFSVTYRVEDNWDEAIRSLREGRADLIPNLGDTEARRKEFGFTSSLETFRVSLFVRSDTFTIHGLADLAGRRVAVVRANVGETLLTLRPEIHVESYPDFPDALFALLSGNVDALVYPEPWTWSRARGANVADQIKVVGEPLSELKRALAVRADQQALLARVEKAVQQVLSTPEYRAIYASWLGEAQPFWTVRQIAWVMGSLLLLTIVGMGAWRYRTMTRAYLALKTAQAEQDRTEARRQRVFETSSVSLWEEDITEVRRLIESRRVDVMAGWEHYFDEHPELVTECAWALKVLEVNEATLRLYETDTKQQLLGSIEQVFTDESYVVFKKELVAIAEGQRQFIAEAVNRTLCGREIDVLISISIPPVDSLIQHIVVAVLDITENKLAEKERERLFRELEQRNREMESFVYTISHDLKSPLITINGFAKLLAKDLERSDKESGRESLEEIQKAALGMQQLIEDLLMLSRTGLIQPEPEDVDMEALVEDIQKRCASHIERERATIRVLSPLPHLHIDRERFGQVLQNLLDNGVKFHREGVAPVLEIGAEQKSGETRLYVRDNGIGIEKRYQEKIFGLFQRLDTKIEGTGVGLTIARRIVEQHGGRLTVESEPGRGSTFWLSLPDSAKVGQSSSSV